MVNCSSLKIYGDELVNLKQIESLYKDLQKYVQYFNAIFGSFVMGTENA